MQPLLIVEVDSRRAERLLQGVADAMAKGGYPGAMKRTGVLLARTVDLNYRNRGRGWRFADLAPGTIRARLLLRRRTGGRLPVAGLDTPMRLSDALRRASIATQAGAKGSAYRADAHGVQVGPDEEQVPYARRAILGGRRRGRGGTVPARDPRWVPDPEVDRMAGEVAVDLRALVRRVQNETGAE